MAKSRHSYINGVRIVFDDEKGWVYESDGKPLKKDGEVQFRPCPKCNKLPTREGHDACLGTLPGVKYACCGHGIRPGYVTFENGKRIGFSKEVIIENE